MFHKRKFESLSKTAQHKQLLFQLKKGIETGSFEEYHRLSSFLGYPIFSNSVEEISARYHEHTSLAGLSYREHSFLDINKEDSKEPKGDKLPVCLYLEKLRSAFNVGAILRTFEAFHFDTVYFSEGMAGANHPKVKKSAMGAENMVRFYDEAKIEDLPGPLIALEITPAAHSLFSYRFPKKCTLMLGNEEYGLSQKTLEKADAVVRIPLFGRKNSLNVASAFAISASFIRAQSTTN